MALKKVAKKKTAPTRASPRHWDDAVKRTAAERWARGESSLKIAAELGIDAPTLYSWARKLSVVRDPSLLGRREDHPKKAEAVRRVAAGEHVPDVASDLFLEKGTVYSWTRALRAAEDSGTAEEDTSPGESQAIVPSSPRNPVNPYAVPLPFGEPNGQLSEPEHEPRDVQVSMVSLEVTGIPTRPGSDVRKISHKRFATSKVLLIRATCPHCGHDGPAPAPAQRDAFIATAFRCPSCDGTVSSPY